MNGQAEVLKKTFASSALCFALLSDTFKVTYINETLRKSFPCFEDPVQLCLLFSDVDFKTLRNYLEAEKSYRLLHDLPGRKNAELTLQALFSEQKFCGAALLFSPESENESEKRYAEGCQLALNRELRDRLTLMFTSIYALSKLPDPELSDRFCEYINSINQNCYQLLRASGNLSRALQLSQHNDHTDFHLMDFSDFIAQFIRAVVRMDNKNRVPVHLHIEEDGALPVEINLVRMEFVLSNLLLNSIKYTRDGNEITVSLRRIGRNVVLSVADKGAGMPRDILCRVGTPFFTYSHRERFIPGLGLGLYISKNYIASHGGSFHLKSEEGRGTVATLSLPLAEMEELRYDSVLTLESPPPFLPEDRFSQTAIQLSDICFYPVL